MQPVIRKLQIGTITTLTIEMVSEKYLSYNGI